MSTEMEAVPLLMVGNFLSESVGTRGVCEDLALQLLQSGWPVITTSNRVSRLPRLLDMLKTVWRNRRDFSVAQVDVYSGMGFWWAEAVCGLLGLMNKPYVLTLHGGNLPNFSERWPGRVHRLLSGATAVTAPSRYLLERMRKYRTDLRLHPNPVPLERYHFRIRVVPVPRLLWLRAFHSVYNPCLAARVMHLLLPEFPSARLTMFGPDKGDGSLKAMQVLMSRIGVCQHINIAGKIAKHSVPQVLDQADIFLNTTNVDNTPVSIIEAMASGMCIVSTNVGGLSYLLEDGKDSLLVPADDAEAMAQAVSRILTEPGLAEQLSLNARRKAEQFDWSVVLPQWKQLLQSVAYRR